MIKTVNYALVSLAFYSLSTNVYRLGLAGFNVPLVLVPIIFLGAPALQGLQINKNFLLVAELLLLYITVIIVSSMLSDPQVSIIVVVKELVCFVVLTLSYALAKNKSDKEISGLLFGIAIASGTWALCHTLFYRFVLHASYLSISLDGIVSEAGKNQIANYLGALTVLSFFMMFQPTSSAIVKWATRFSFVFHLAALVYTFSRSALIGAIFIIGIYSFFSFKKQLLRFISLRGIILFGVVLVVAAYVGVSDDLVSQFTDNIASVTSFHDEGDSTSIAVRQELIRNALQIFTGSPILGEGPGMFANTVGIATHNSYVQLLAESGLAGLISYLIFIMTPIFLRDRNPVVLVLKPVIAYVAFSLFFENALDSILLYFFIGLLCAKTAAVRYSSYSYA